MDVAMAMSHDIVTLHIDFSRISYIREEFMNKKWLFLLCLLITLALSGCALPGSRAASLKIELKEALNNYLAVTNEARITYDKKDLSSVSTGQDLQSMLDYIEYYKKLEAEGKADPVHSSEEFKIEWVNVLASGSPWAVIEAKESYRSFSLDLRTMKKEYDNITRWRVLRYLFIKEDGKWKMDRILEDVSWSG
jgi:hypothetical protein